MSRGTCDVCIRGKGHVACDALHGDRAYLKKYQQMSKGKPQFGGPQLEMPQLPGPPEMQELPECSQSSRCSGSTDSYGLAGAAGGAEQQ